MEPTGRPIEGQELSRKDMEFLIWFSIGYRDNKARGKMPMDREEWTKAIVDEMLKRNVRFIQGRPAADPSVPV